jgi:hypothetical protein
MKISGAIDHAILCYRGRRFIFYLDNHDVETYCPESSRFIDDELARLLSTANIYLEEPVFSEQRKQAVLRGEVGYHMKKYLAFIHRNNGRYCPFDLRKTFTDKDGGGKEVNLAGIVSMLKNQGHESLSTDFERQLRCLMRVLIDRCDENKCREHRSRLVAAIERRGPEELPFFDETEKIHTMFPFHETKEVFATPSMILDATMEFFMILLIFSSRREVNVIYGGALHCIRVIKILTTFYGFEVIRPLRLDLHEIVLFSDLDSLDSCTPVPSDDLHCPFQS